MSSIYEKLTGHIRQAISEAWTLAANAGHVRLTPLHLLYAFVSERGSIAQQVLKRAGLSKQKILTTLMSTSPTTATRALPDLDSDAKQAILKGALYAENNSHVYVGTEHVLWAIMQLDTPLLSAFFKKYRVNTKEMLNSLESVLQSTSKFSEMSNSFHEHHPAPLVPTREQEKKPTKKKAHSTTPALDFFAVELTTPETIAKLDPLVGRNNEILRIMQIVCRRTKNNPILLGEPGVGKTAIVEGLARLIADGTVPEPLIGKRIFSLDLGLVIAGSVYRGEFEARFKQIIDEIKQDPNIILFIDEIHTLIGAGSSSGSMDAANLLKPALARGLVRCIGATTFEEYKRHIENDPALERRFQPVYVSEPNAEATKEILIGIAKRYEEFHHVTFAPEAIDAAVSLAVRYIPEKHLPDKAIDILDETAAAARLGTQGDRRRRMRAEAMQALNKVAEQKEEAVAGERFETAIALKEREQKLLEALHVLDKDLAEDAPEKARVGAEEIIATVAKITGMPTAQLQERIHHDFTGLISRIKEEIVGHDAVIEKIARSIGRAEAGLTDNRRPRASFLFVGPSGVGKTRLAEALAHALFEDDDRIIHLDMSEYAEGFSISKLIGAPAGYVGYKDTTSLTDRIKRHPYSILLLDDVDKAHRDVLNLFLQILEDGTLTDAGGKKISFKNTIIIFTTTTGSETFSKASIGFAGKETSGAANDAKIKEVLVRELGSELINRVQEICVLPPLTTQDIKNIVALELKGRARELTRRQIKLVVAEEVIETIAEKSFDAQEGGRLVRKNIGAMLDDGLADLINTNLDRPLTITAILAHGQVKFEVR